MSFAGGKPLFAAALLALLVVVQATKKCSSAAKGNVETRILSKTKLNYVVPAGAADFNFSLPRDVCHPRHLGGTKLNACDPSGAAATVDLQNVTSGYVRRNGALDKPASVKARVYCVRAGSAA